MRNLVRRILRYLFETDETYYTTVGVRADEER
jgi:hypothetical protein